MNDFENELLDAIEVSITPAMIRREWIRNGIAPVIEKLNLPYLQACAAEWEAFGKMEGTPETKVVFMEQTVRKLAKMKAKAT